GAFSAPAEQIGLATLVREVSESFAPVAEEQVRSFAWTAEPGAIVRGTPPLLRRLLLNLVDNAFRHTPAASAVRVGVRVEADHAAIEVEDGGPGIPAEELGHVFERFRRGRGSHSGFGLGLAL